LVPNERGLLRPGGFAKASIIVDAESRAAVVPTESIVRFAGVTKLFIVENGKARSINDIQTGAEGRGWVEVTSTQLPATAQIVTTGQTQLAEGTPVVVREPEPPALPKSGQTGTIPETAAVPGAPSRR
jgi:membrane fusion protein (multidrug efflux system)